MDAEPKPLPDPDADPADIFGDEDEMTEPDQGDSGTADPPDPDANAHTQ